MDQREWGLLRETVVRRTRASGASREDAEDATHDALLAAIGRPQHPQSEVAWLSTVAKRRRVDLIRQRVREEQVPPGAGGASGMPDAYDPTAVGPEDVVVDRAHASWLTASLTQLPATTREVVDAVGSGMDPAEVASSMNLSTRSVESHLTRARRHLRRMGALSVPVGVLLTAVLRTRPSARVALVAAVPVVAAVVVLLPAARPLEPRPEAAPTAPATALPAPAVVAPGPRSLPGPGLPVPAAVPPAAAPAAPAQPEPAGPDAAGTAVPDGSAAPAPAEDAAPFRPAVTPEGRSLPPQCSLQLPVLGNLGCILADLVGGVVSSTVDSVAPAPAVPAPLPAQPPPG
ncbi:MAG TPA: sigma-70 family RNA polymerase sigma factor [Pseudonocardiaceae bacterium]|nr:sigma-70 family RNA polymerase sigma factor [Pseudonocardiaceae bacterium]